MSPSADVTGIQTQKGLWRHKLKGYSNENPALIEAKFWDIEELRS